MAGLNKPNELSKPADELLKTWWALESEVREIARAQDPFVAELADVGFALLHEGHKLTMTGKWQLWEAIFGLAIGQLENTSASAWELAYAGYYAQARALMRLMTEYLAVAWYLPNHQDEAYRWNQPSVQPPGAGELLQAVFATDTESGENFHELRKYLHRYAHQDSVGLLTIYEPGADPTDLGINMRARFVQPEFQAVARELVILHASIPAVMSDWRGDRHPEWRDRVRRYVERVANMADTYDAREAAKRDGGDSS